jgi:hypothetical protein
MGFGWDRDRRVAVAVFLCALGLAGAPAGAATLTFTVDGAVGDVPVASAEAAGGIAAPPGGWTLFSAERTFLAAGAGLFSGSAYRDAMLASVYSGAGSIQSHWSGAPSAAGDETRSIAAAKAPVSAAVLNAMFYLLLAALMLSAAVGHIRSRRGDAR